MTPENLRTAREGMGITQNAIAESLGLTGRTWRRYEGGFTEIPYFVELLIEIMEGDMATKEKVLTRKNTC